MNKRPSRRDAIVGFAITALGAKFMSVARAAAQPKPAAGTCLLFPEAVEGPFYFDSDLVRRDITESRPGLPLDLTLRVVEHGSCTPIANTRVDVWHADARGVYSGYARQGDTGNISAKGETYLRGTQLAGDTGKVSFRTIYPGWYPGRTPHIHVKVWLDAETLATGQVYFPDELSDRIYRSHRPYTARAVRDMTNPSDWIFRAGTREGGGIVLATEEDAGTITASLTIAVARKGA